MPILVNFAFLGPCACLMTPLNISVKRHFLPIHFNFLPSFIMIGHMIWPFDERLVNDFDLFCPFLPKKAKYDPKKFFWRKIIFLKKFLISNGHKILHLMKDWLTILGLRIKNLLFQPKKRTKKAKFDPKNFFGKKIIFLKNF